MSWPWPPGGGGDLLLYAATREAGVALDAIFLNIPMNLNNILALILSGGKLS